MHVIEHIGLGRYGDPLDPDGDIKAINELKKKEEEAPAEPAAPPRSEVLLEEIRDALVTDRSISSYPQPMLADQFNYLYGNTQRADQKPAVDMYERLDDLKGQLEAHKERLQRLIRTITDR